MIIIGDNGKKILDCESIFVAPRHDYNDRNSTFCYDVKGQLQSGRIERVATFNSESEAIEFIKLLALDMEDRKVLMRPLEVKYELGKYKAFTE